jgi:hypothetical protein
MRWFQADPPRLICRAFVAHLIVLLLWSTALLSLEKYRGQPRLKLAITGARGPLWPLLLFCAVDYHAASTLLSGAP